MKSLVVNCVGGLVKLLLAPLSFTLLAVAWILTVIIAWPLLSLMQLFCKPQHPKEPKKSAIVEPEMCDVENSPFRVAIVGSGWTGLCAARELKQRGIQVQLFEARDDLGGTWHPDANYEGLSIHSPLLTVELDGFPHPEIAFKGYERISCAEVHKYLSSFADFYNLRPHIRFNTKVTSINHDTGTRLATVGVADTVTGEEALHSGYHAVLFASSSAKPTLPTLPGESTFSGEIIHSSAMNVAKFKELIEANKRVVVLGGSKSAVDMLMMFVRKGYDNVQWLYRTSYYFLRYEHTLAHQSTYSVIGRLRGFFLTSCMSLSVLSSSLACFAMWMLGGIDTVFDRHFDFRRFHFGTLLQSQIDILRNNFKDRVLGSVSTLTPTGVEVNVSGGKKKHMDCDVLICCTGYETGISDLNLSIDGEPFALPRKPVKLFEYLALPEFPSLIFGLGYYQIGPRRGASLGQHIVRYLHMNPTIKQMERSTKWNLVETNLRQLALFSSDKVMTKTFVLWMIDMLRTGVFSFQTMYMGAYSLWVQNHPVTLNVKNLDKQIATQQVMARQATEAAKDVAAEDLAIS